MICMNKLRFCNYKKYIYSGNIKPMKKETVMFYVSTVKTAAPDEFRTELQEMVYRTLGELGIAFARVDTDEAITMEDCVHINHTLDMKMVKTLFLCNRKQTEFFLFVTPGGKPFKSREFSEALGVSRVSFAPADLMETMLGTKIGAATVFSALLESAKEVKVVIDRDVAGEEWYGCSDGTTTGYMKVRTAQIIDALLPHAKHEPVVVHV